MTCKELMTAQPVACLPTDNVVSAAMLMKAHDIGSVPIISSHSERKLLGIVTDRDLTLRVVAEQRDYYKTTVEEVMSADLVTCRDDDDHAQVLKAMKKKQIRRVPVLDRQDRLVGIIAQADVAQSADQGKVADVVGAISERTEDHQRGPDMGKAALIIAGGLSVGAGLVYWVKEVTARARPEVHSEPSNH
jgi:CBS domain-containing protein